MSQCDFTTRGNEQLKEIRRELLEMIQKDIEFFEEYKLRNIFKQKIVCAVNNNLKILRETYKEVKKRYDEQNNISGGSIRKLGEKFSIKDAYARNIVTHTTVKQPNVGFAQANNDSSGGKTVRREDVICNTDSGKLCEL